MTSFLDGGEYGKLSLGTVVPEDAEGLPFIGYVESFTLASQKFAANQPFFPYGGIRTVIDRQPGIYGNSVYNTALSLVYQVFPNPDSTVLVDGSTVPLFVVAQDSLSTQCIGRNEATGLLEQISVKALDDCLSTPIAEMSISKGSPSGLELDLALGAMPTRTGLTFFLATQSNSSLLPITGVGVTDITSRLPSTYLTNIRLQQAPCLTT